MIEIVALPSKLIERES